MASIFSKIIAGEIPCYKIAEDEKHFAFLDISPVAIGHVLVVPKLEINNIFDLEPAEFSGLWLFAQTIAKGLAKAIPCVRVGTAVIGLEVPHAHIHLIPMQTVADINFSKPKLSPSAEILTEIAKRIVAALK